MGGFIVMLWKNCFWFLEEPFRDHFFLKNQFFFLNVKNILLFQSTICFSNS